MCCNVTNEILLLRKEKEELEAKIKSLENELKEVQIENGRLNQELCNAWRESREDRNLYNGRLYGLNIEIQRLKEKNNELEAEVSKVKREYDEDVAAYEADMEELYLRIDSLDKENNLLKEQAKDHEICYRDLENNWNSIYEQNQELKKEIEVLKAGNEELAKKLIDTEHMRDQYGLLYDKYQTLFSVTEEMALDLNKLLDDTYDLLDKVTWANALSFVIRIKECIAPKKDIIKEWSTTMDRERTYYDKQLEVAYRKSREFK